MNILNPTAQKVQQLLNEAGLKCKVVELSESTRTAKEAAEAIGCKVEEIVKSIIFKGTDSGKPVLVIASGINRINEKRISEIISEKIEKADADFVKSNTGFVIGGVPPFGHKENIKTFIDEDLLQYMNIWAAAGTPFTVFQITPDDLLKICKGNIISVK